ncbi:uncharacterized protein LOC109810240 [Cajanus cajan]|uniref:uncharacterized protein LOC109810240 n=1 Tax=Cajanus cajan TaxID=3821 RepID=UPI00098DA72E|nr:uncharacterized protein LOC109810240 [Cajanus cajan]
MPGVPNVPGVRRSENWSPVDIRHLVVVYIERCLELYINKENIVQALEDQADIAPAFTELVLEELEKENKEFFENYYAVLASREERRQLMGSSATANSSHPTLDLLSNHAVLSNGPQALLQPHSNGWLTGSASHNHAVSTQPNSNGHLTTTTSSTNGSHNPAVLSQPDSNGGIIGSASHPNSNGGLTTTTSSTTSHGSHDLPASSQPDSNMPHIP